MLSSRNEEGLSMESIKLWPRVVSKSVDMAKQKKKKVQGRLSYVAHLMRRMIVDKKESVQ